MPRKNGIAENPNADENDQNVINDGEDVREEPNQDQNGAPAQQGNQHGWGPGNN